MTAAAPRGDPSPYASALLSMVRGIEGREDAEYLKAAGSLEALVERGDIPANLSYYATVYSALCYDIAGARGGAERMYMKMDARYGGEMERIIPSRTHAERLARGLSMLGRRKAGAFSRALSEAIEWIKAVESETGGPIMHDNADDYTVMLSSMALLDDFFAALTGPGEGDATGRLARAASEQYGELHMFDLSPQVALMARLYLQLIRAASERAVAALGIGGDVKRGLLDGGKYELWPPQKRAVEAGLLDGRSIVCAAPPGSGKSLLAHLALAGSGRGRRGTAAYLVPTEPLAGKAGGELKAALGGRLRLVVSGRDANGGDGALRGMDMVVATYEKMGALLRSGKIGPEDIRTVIVDGVGGAGGGGRLVGMDLEMLLARLRAAGPPGRQFVALSASAAGGDAQSLAEWLGARPVVDERRPAGIESICLDGWLHGRDGDLARLPDAFAAPGGTGSAEKRLRACFALARRALVDGGRALVLVREEADAPGVASGIGDMMRRSAGLDPDLAEALRRGEAERKGAARSIEEADAEMPPHAAWMAGLLRSGVAYDHAGLGPGYRAAAEGAAGRACVVAAASAADAWIGAPFHTVVLYDPLPGADGGGGGGVPRLDAPRYRMMAGGAERAAVLLAASDGEANRMREVLWDSEGDVGLRSALGAALDGGAEEEEEKEERIAGMDRLLLHILGLICEGGAGGASAGSVADRLLSSSWFCHSEPPDEGRRSRIEARVLEGIERLEGMGLVSAGGSGGGAYAATPAGDIAGGSMLAPGSFSMIRGCIERLGRMGLGGGDLEAALLVVAASPAEVRGRHGGMASGAEVPERLARLRRALGDPGGEGGARLAAVLHHWAASAPLAEIMRRCGMDEARAGGIGDGLAADAAWILSTAAGMARDVPGAGAEIAGALEDAAESCRLGTSDPLARSLVGMGLPGMGRETAIRLAAHLRGRGKRIEDMERPEVTGLFAGNPAGAARLCESLENAGLMRRAEAARARPAPAPAAGEREGGIPAAQGGAGGPRGGLRRPKNGADRAL